MEVTETSEQTAEPGRQGSADIKSVLLTFRVLFELARANEPTGVSELARRLGEARAAVHKHLNTLRGLGLVMQGARSDRYRLGWKLVELGLAAEAQCSIVAIADPHLVRLRDLSGLSTFLVQAHGDGSVVSHSVPSESPIAVTVRKGLPVPLHGSAGGRVALAFSEPALQDKILSGTLAGMSTRMLTDSEQIRARLAAIRERLYDTTEGESPSGIYSLAAPVFDEQGGFVASVGMLGTHAQVHVPAQPGQIAWVQQCAASISAALGSQAYAQIGVEAWV